MAVLIPKHNKISPLNRPSYFIGQVFDVLGEGNKIFNKDSEEGQEKIFFTDIQAERLGTTLMQLLDNNDLENAVIHSSWSATGNMSFLSFKKETSEEIAERASKNRHKGFYSQNFVDEIHNNNIVKQPLRDFQEESLADISAFMLLSKGFYVQWT